MKEQEGTYAHSVDQRGTTRILVGTQGSALLSLVMTLRGKVAIPKLTVFSGLDMTQSN